MCSVPPSEELPLGGPQQICESRNTVELERGRIVGSVACHEYEEFRIDAFAERELWTRVCITTLPFLTIEESAESVWRARQQASQVERECEINIV